jgi:hypothetical protein
MMDHDWPLRGGKGRQIGEVRDKPLLQPLVDVTLQLADLLQDWRCGACIEIMEPEDHRKRCSDALL